ncbi:MAG: hypothetical protein DMG11_20485 [Acidobacteria bacterium]|nr:MAG: hypothetical protein DMG11_20485 [Acidobacteriota bacterium]
MFSFEKDLLIFVAGIIKYYDSAFFGELAYSAIALEKLVGIEALGPGAHKFARRAIQVDKCKTAFTGNDSILPVEKEKLFVGNHVEKRGNGEGRCELYSNGPGA